MYIYICIFLGPPTVRKVDKDQQFTASQNAVLKWNPFETGPLRSRFAYIWSTNLLHRPSFFRVGCEKCRGLKKELGVEHDPDYHSSVLAQRNLRHERSTITSVIWSCCKFCCPEAINKFFYWFTLEITLGQMATPKDGHPVWCYPNQAAFPESWPDIFPQLDSRAE